MYTVYLYICIYIHDLAPVASPLPQGCGCGMGGWGGRVVWEGASAGGLGGWGVPGFGGGGAGVMWDTTGVGRRSGTRSFIDT